MKYRNALTRKLLKEFRSFIKWAPKGCYAMKGNSPEEQAEYFNQRIKEIIKNQEEVV